MRAYRQEKRGGGEFAATKKLVPAALRAVGRPTTIVSRKRAADDHGVHAALKLRVLERGAAAQERLARVVESGLDRMAVAAETQAAAVDRAADALCQYVSIYAASMRASSEDEQSDVLGGDGGDGDE